MLGFPQRWSQYKVQAFEFWKSVLFGCSLKIKMKRSFYFAVVLSGISSSYSSSLAGRTTNKFYSLENGGYHHHGGFLAGYKEFYRGNINNSQDNFSNKYVKNSPAGTEDTSGHHYIYRTRKPEFEQVDKRLLIPLQRNTSFNTYFLENLFNKQVSFSAKNKT